jgi:pyruvate kinase
MLSGETATGAYPIDTVRIVRQIIAEAECQDGCACHGELDILDSSASKLGMSLGKAACAFAEQMGATALACLSDTGNAAIRLTAQRPRVPVYMFSERKDSVRRMAMVRSAHGLLLERPLKADELFPQMEAILFRRGLIREGAPVVYTAGLSLRRNVTTNTIHLRTTHEAALEV